MENIIWMIIGIIVGGIVGFCGFSLLAINNDKKD